MGATTERVEGLDRGPVTDWLVDNVAGLEPPVTFDLIAGGHSNLTYKVTDRTGGRWVLRRPPLGHVLATAHDMSREHTIIAALGPTPVPVAPAVGLCTDVSVTGAPFYVMGFVDGLVLRDAEAATAELDLAGRRRAGQSLVDVLADIHAVEPARVGLGELGRTEGYISRQLKRWYGQWQQSKPDHVSDVDEVHDHLAANIPDQGPACIVHGDYRLDNCMLSPQGEVLAVLDWEICTLGDPLADVGLLQVYWTEAGDEHAALLAAPTIIDGFPTRAEMLARYAERSGRDVSSIDFYVAFGYWKLACIIAGVYDRYRHGAMGDVDQRLVDGFGAQVRTLAELATERAGRIG